jgi:hypothetical protein
MIEWLAIVAFCVKGECGFYAETKEPYISEAACMVKVDQLESYLNRNGIDTTFGGCIPVKFVRA